jgi:hypothetical protein
MLTVIDLNIRGMDWNIDGGEKGEEKGCEKVGNSCRILI